LISRYDLHCSTVTISYITVQENNRYFREGTATCLTFILKLNQLIAVGEPAARVIECLEAARATVGDIWHFWVAMLKMMKESLDNADLDIPREAAGQVRAVVNARWKEFFEDGPNPYHAGYVQSDIFRKPNPLQSTTITIKGKGVALSDRVPKGIAAPKIFDKVGRYLAQVTSNEIQYGTNPHFEPRVATTHST